jgi:hypothetical protein
MRMVVVLVAMLGACGGGSSGKPPPAEPAKPAASAPARSAPPVAPEAFCDHLAKLNRECPQFANMRLDPRTCVDEMRRDLASPKLSERTRSMVSCIVVGGACEAVFDCITANKLDPTAALRACDDSSQNTTEHAAAIPRHEWEHRNGAQVALFRDAHSTKQTPIEMCGVPQTNQWLAALRCNDGTQPIHNADDAEDARAGNVGLGGRCHSIVDRYQILCPERRYELFIDAYLCPRGD